MTKEAGVIMDCPLYWQAEALKQIAADAQEDKKNLTKEQVLERISTVIISFEQTPSSKLLSDMVNSFSFNPAKTADELLDKHRTLQQSFMKLCLEYIKAQAKVNPQRCDARNERTLELSRRIVEAIGEDELYVPFI